MMKTNGRTSKEQYEEDMAKNSSQEGDEAGEVPFTLGDK